MLSCELIKANASKVGALRNRLLSATTQEMYRTSDVGNEEQSLTGYDMACPKCGHTPTD